MSEETKPKPCGAYLHDKGWYAAQRGCQRPSVNGGLCREHAAGRKRSEAARAKADAKYVAAKVEDERRKRLFYQFIAEMDASKAVKSGTLALYTEVRKHLRMQMVHGDYTIRPLEKEQK